MGLCTTGGIQQQARPLNCILCCQCMPSGLSPFAGWRTVPAFLCAYIAHAFVFVCQSTVRTPARMLDRLSRTPCCKKLGMPDLCCVLCLMHATHASTVLCFGCMLCSTRVQAWWWLYCRRRLSFLLCATLDIAGGMGLVGGVSGLLVLSGHRVKDAGLWAPLGRG